jgi:hypothetical protein
MSRTVTVQELREKLEEIIAEVEAGGSVTIVANDMKRGEVTLLQRGRPYPFRDLEISPLSKPLGIDPIDALIEERDGGRTGK